jgi:hypothetical protein
VAEEDGVATYICGQVHSDSHIQFGTQCCILASITCSFSLFGSHIITVLHISMLDLFHVAFGT